MSELPPDQSQRDFTAPKEGNQFEVLPPPEFRPGMHEFKSVDKESGELVNHEIQDEKGRQIYQRQRRFADDRSPSPDTLKSDWQNFSLAFDGQNRATKERSQRLMAGSESQTYIENTYNEDGSVSTKGTIEAGEAGGHSYETTRGTPVDLGHGRQKIEEITVILEQGSSSKKPATGTKIVKQIYIENSQYAGERWTNVKTKETGVNLPKNVAVLPDWAVAG